MSKNIYYITRSYPKLREHAGGSSLLRKNTVILFRKAGYKVIVVTPNYGSNKLIEDFENDIVLVPYTKNEKLYRIFQRFGMAEDYLDEWATNSINYLEKKVTKSDIVFSTTGGELASIKVSSVLKQKTGCSNVINFRDPINYGNYNGLKRDNLFHVSREKHERNYLANADAILTSCPTFESELLRKYPELKNSISNNYFGYIGNPLIKEVFRRNRNLKVRIVYGGNFSSTQAPELICEVIANHPYREKIELTLVGNYKGYKPVQKYLNLFQFIDKIPHSEYSEFISKNSDIGFVPLRGEYYKYCFPSKIFEYLNHGLVILGALPDGDALDFINRNKYGAAVKFDDKNDLANAITKLLDNSLLDEYRSRIVSENDQWSMNNQITHTLERLNDLKTINP